jgi:hypothetical protein
MGKSNSEDALTLKQRDFLTRYLDKNSSTYGNKTRSYMAAFQKDNYASSAVSANRLLKKVKIREVIDRETHRYDLDIEVRLRTLVDIAKSPDIGVTETDYYPETGEKITRSGPKYSDVIKVIDMINRACGLY